MSDALSRPDQVLRRQSPSHLVYAPNYWQWFAHQRNHGRLPAEIAASQQGGGLVEGERQSSVTSAA